MKTTLSTLLRLRGASPSKPSIHRLAIGFTALLLCLPPAAQLAFGQSDTARAPYLDTSLPAQARARDLVSRMTTEEKISQVANHAAAIPRLGVAEYDYWSEGLHGVARAGYATVFPQAIGMAATWDTTLIHHEGQTIASEARIKYAQATAAHQPSIFFGVDIWSPNINIFRDPRWGRGQETYGEDPLLTARLGSAFVMGLQGDDPLHPTAIATPKHFAVHSGPEPLRHGFNVNMSPHDFEDTYLPAFRATIVDAHAGSIMCAYNAIDGSPACASDLLLKEKLRGAWGFKGYVTSDCGAIDDIFAGHKSVPDRASATAAALKAGMDTACGGEKIESAATREALQRNLITQADLDLALTRLFTARFELGTFDTPPPTPLHPHANHELELAAAHEAIVLLKNDGVLPLAASARTIAIIGPNAVSLPALEGNYNGVPVNPVFPVDASFGTHNERHILYAQGAPLVEGMFTPVPRTVFHTASGAAGLDAEYNQTGTPAAPGVPSFHRIDPEIDFDWNAANPFSNELTRPAQAFSVKWSGTITPPTTGDITFRVAVPDCYPCHDEESYRVTLDGKVVSEEKMSSDARHPKLEPFTVHFADTKPHALQMEYSHHSPIFAAGATLSWQPPIQAMRNEAVAIAKQSDIVVAYIGLSPKLEGEEMKVDLPGFNGGDRTSLDLPQSQQALLEALAATGKPLVVVLLNGSALGLQWASTHANAIVEAWYPGGRGGQAIADVLTGAYNPAGRLPITFYASASDLPPFQDYSMANRTYRYFHGKPLYPFGFGLSYTKFAYSNLQFDESTIHAGSPLKAAVNVKNTGTRDGDEVVELYLQPPASPTNPRRMLVAFSRIHLAAGEQRLVSFSLDPRSLSLVDAQGNRSMRGGEYRLSAGGAQPSDTTPHTDADFKVMGDFPLPK